MVRNYKRKKEAPNWNLETLARANEAIKSGISIRKASMEYGVPFSVLQRYVKKTVLNPGRVGGFRPVFSCDFEEKLKTHILDLQLRFYGMTKKDIRKLAFTLAESLHLDHPFNKVKKMAGEDWLSGFLKRNADISVRSPEPTSIARATGFNREEVGKFFDILKESLATFEYTASQIWNADESGLTTVHKPGKILAKKGCKQVGKFTSGERGQTTTILCAMNANGTYVPPMIIFARKKSNELLLRGAPAQSLLCVSENGWTNKELFVKWLQHFVKHVRPSKDSKQLLILDGHESHKSIEAIEFAQKHFIEMIILPPHTTHRLQPLDRVFFGPLKANYNAEVDRWMLNHPGRRVTSYDVSELFGYSYEKTADLRKSINGFKCTGIHPFNPDIFPSYEFPDSFVGESNPPPTSSRASTGPDPPPTSSRALTSKRKLSPKEYEELISKTFPLPNIQRRELRTNRKQSACRLTSYLTDGGEFLQL